MSFQTIINDATNISIDVNPITSAVMSRSNRLKTATRGPAIYRFDVNVAKAYKWTGANRALLQTLQTKGRTTEEEITLSSTTGMGYIMGYAGTVSSQLSNLTIDSFTGDKIVMDTASTTGIQASDIIFEVGDYVQPANSRYTYQVRQRVTGADISLGLIDVFMNRNIFPSTSDGGNNIVNQSVNVANNCSFHVKCLDLPAHTLVPGQLFTFDGNFTFVEVIL